MDILPEITDLFFMAINDTESHFLNDLFILLFLGLFLLFGASLTFLTHLEQLTGCVLVCIAEHFMNHWTYRILFYSETYYKNPLKKATRCLPVSV